MYGGYILSYHSFVFTIEVNNSTFHLTEPTVRCWHVMFALDYFAEQCHQAATLSTGIKVFPIAC